MLFLLPHKIEELNNAYKNVDLKIVEKVRVRSYCARLEKEIELWNIRALNVENMYQHIKWCSVSIDSLEIQLFYVVLQVSKYPLILLRWQE